MCDMTGCPYCNLFHDALISVVMSRSNLSYMRLVDMMVFWIQGFNRRTVYGKSRSTI
jgi:hypothetical protein